MTYYSSIVLPKDITSHTTKQYQRPSFFWAAGPTYSGIDMQVLTSLSPAYINTNNATLNNSTSTYSSDYANYVVVNNDTSDWVLTLPLGPSSVSTTAVWPGACTFHLNIKKTGTGTLTIQTPIDTAGTRVRGINSLSNKSYTLSSNSAQSITLIYTYGYTHTGTIDSTAEIWFVF